MTATTFGDAPWQSLTAEQKRSRVLAVAGELFASEGPEFPMPELAKAVGAGVGSLYRQVGKKEDVLAALVVDRLTRITQRYATAADSPDPMAALRVAVSEVIDECVSDRVTRSCWDYAVGRPDCDHARAQARVELRRLVENAKGPGGLRDDASSNDLRALFRASPSAELIEPGAGQRLGQLVLDGLTRH